MRRLLAGRAGKGSAAAKAAVWYRSAPGPTRRVHPASAEWCSLDRRFAVTHGANRLHHRIGKTKIDKTNVSRGRGGFTGHVPGSEAPAGRRIAASRVNMATASSSTQEPAKAMREHRRPRAERNGGGFWPIRDPMLHRKSSEGRGSDRSIRLRSITFVCLLFYHVLWDRARSRSGRGSSRSGRRRGGPGGGMRLKTGIVIAGDPQLDGQEPAGNARPAGRRWHDGRRTPAPERGLSPMNVATPPSILSAPFSATYQDTPEPDFSSMSAIQRINWRVFEGGVTTACGFASSAVGPSYCPATSRSGPDLQFFRVGTTPVAAIFAQPAVIAHEIGHHIQISHPRLVHSQRRPSTKPESGR